MNPRLYLPLLVLSILPACTAAHPGPADAAINPATGETPTARGALALIRLQNSSGAFNGPSKTDHVGITGIAGLALLSASDVAPSTTAPHIRRAADFLLTTQLPDGYFTRQSGSMYDHAFATLFLTQLYAVTTDAPYKEKLAESLRKAVQLIETAQNAQGGWRYAPTPGDADVSVTAAQLKSLATAKDLGFNVPDITIARAISYLKSNQQPDGGFSYTLNTKGSAWPRSAAATAALLYAGTAPTGDTAKALDYITNDKTHLAQPAFFYYGSYYLAQALNLDPAQTNTVPALRAALLKRQNPSTFLWSGEAGDPYATAMALIVLYMPNSQLPAFKPPAALAPHAP